MSFRLSVGRNVLNPKEAKRLVNRDPHAALMRVAGEIKNQKALDDMLKKLPEHARRPAYDALVPFLKFEARYLSALVEI